MSTGKIKFFKFFSSHYPCGFPGLQILETRKIRLSQTGASANPHEYWGSSETRIVTGFANPVLARVCGSALVVSGLAERGFGNPRE